MRLHRLERPEPWPAEIEAAMRAFPPANWYPDYASFHSRLCRHAGVENLVIGAGVEGLIRDLFILCGGPVAYTWPTCAMFDVYASAFGVEPVRLVTPPDGVGVDEVAAVVRERRPALLILPNPGQPVDVCFGPGEMARIATACAESGAVLAVDEAYHGFGAPSSVGLVDEYDNVVVLRSFSKAMGAAALRVGYAIAGNKITGAMDAIRMSGEVSGPSAYAATVLMDNWPVVERGIAEVVEGRNWLRDQLRADGYRARGEWANHVLVRVGDAAGMAARLAERGVHVRVNAPPLDEWLMVTCGSRGLMQRFYERFREVVCMLRS